MGWAKIFYTEFPGPKISCLLFRLLWCRSGFEAPQFSDRQDIPSDMVSIQQDHFMPFVFSEIHVHDPKSSTHTHTHIRNLRQFFSRFPNISVQFWLEYALRSEVLVALRALWCCRGIPPGPRAGHHLKQQAGHLLVGLVGQLHLRQGEIHKIEHQKLRLSKCQGFTTRHGDLLKVPPPPPLSPLERCRHRKTLQCLVILPVANTFGNSFEQFLLWGCLMFFWLVHELYELKLLLSWTPNMKTLLSLIRNGSASDFGVL